MSFKDCIVNGQREGNITTEQAEELNKIYDQLFIQFSKNDTPENAGIRAGKETFDQVKYNAMHKRRVKLLQLRAWKQALINIDEYPGDPGKAYQAIIANDNIGTFSNLEGRRASLRNQYFGMLTKLLNEYGRNAVGNVRNKSSINQMVKEIFEPGSTGNKNAREIAEAVTKVFEKARITANEYGMRIPKLDNYGLPQLHHVLNIRVAGRDEWKKFIKPLLNPAKMINEQTGNPHTVESLEFALDEVFETIISEGSNKLKPGKMSVYGKSSLSNRRQEHRFLQFKDADSWIQYQERYGEPNAFNVINNHIDKMTSDIAELQILGPNPTTMMKAIETEILRRATNIDKLGGNRNAVNKAQTQIAKAQSYYDAYTSRNNTPVDGRIANIMAGTRHLIQSAFLGSASISAITDMQNMRIASRLAGLPQIKVLKNYFKMLNPLSFKEKAMLGNRLGLIAENYISTTILNARYFGETTGPNITTRISDTVMRVSGLAPMTQAGRQAFGMEFLAHFGSQVNKQFDELDDLLQKNLERYGLTSDDWNLIRKTELYEDNNVKFLDYQKIQEIEGIPKDKAEDIASKVLEMIVTETETAIPSSTLRARASLVGGAKPGTFVGELGRSMAMFKNYPVTVMHTHFMRYMKIKDPKRRVSIVADYIIGVTLMGGLALQAHQVTRGRDPRPMNTPEFWVQALLQGGGLGIFGDFLVSTTSRGGRGLEETVAGPVVGAIGDIGRLTIGNVIELASGKDTNFGRELTRYMAQYTPGASVWYLRLAFERIILDNIQKFVDPKAQRSFRKRERYYREFNQDYYWSPGQTFPSRPPNLGTALGD